MLLFNAFGQMRQIPQRILDLAPHTLQLEVAHQRRRARQAPAGTARNREHRRQILQQFIDWRWRLRRDLLSRF
jgi:hypothetical protein